MFEKRVQYIMLANFFAQISKEFQAFVMKFEILVNFICIYLELHLKILFCQYMNTYCV